MIVSHGQPVLAEHHTVAGQSARWFIPSYLSQGGSWPLVIICHSNNNTDSHVVDDPLALSLRNALLQAGYIVGASQQHNNNWGNQAGIDDIVDLYADINGRFAVSQTFLVGLSMGGLSSLSAYLTGALSVAGWVGIYPAVNLQAMWDGAGYDAKPYIRTAYGLATDGEYAAKTAGHDPALFAASSYNGKHFRFYASPDDTIVVKTQNTDTVSALASGAASNTVIVASGEHGDASHWQNTDIISWLDSL